MNNAMSTTAISPSYTLGKEEKMLRAHGKSTPREASSMVKPQTRGLRRRVGGSTRGASEAAAELARNVLDGFEEGGEDERRLQGLLDVGGDLAREFHRGHRVHASLLRLLDKSGRVGGERRDAVLDLVELAHQLGALLGSVDERGDEPPLAHWVARGQKLLAEKGIEALLDLLRAGVGNLLHGDAEVRDKLELALRDLGKVDLKQWSRGGGARDNVAMPGPTAIRRSVVMAGKGKE